MTLPSAALPRRSWLVTLIGFIVVGLAASALPADAQSQRKLSRGLEKRLAETSDAVRVLYEGPQSEVDRLAAAYGLQVTKRMSAGAVFSGRPAQIRALSQDGNVYDLSEDAIVHGTSDVTAQTTGADQVWRSTRAASAGSSAATSAIAVIDSGIAGHPDIASRVLIQQWTSSRMRRAGDLYGHGTHVGAASSPAAAAAAKAPDSSHVGMAPGAAAHQPEGARRGRHGLRRRTSSRRSTGRSRTQRQATASAS